MVDWPTWIAQSSGFVGHNVLSRGDLLSKNNSGGLKLRKLEAKRVIQHENLDNTVGIVQPIVLPTHFTSSHLRNHLVMFGFLLVWLVITCWTKLCLACVPLLEFMVIKQTIR